MRVSVAPLTKRTGRSDEEGEEDDSPLTPWEQEQLRFLPGVRKRLREELAVIHRHGGSLVDALAGHTDVLTHVLAYAWRSTNALMRTCKRFLAVIGTRAYWKALAERAFAGRIPRAVLTRVNWFHGLADDEPPHSYLWSCVLSPKSRGYGLPRWTRAEPNTLFLTHYRTDDCLLDLARRVIRLRWNTLLTERGATDYWHSLASFTISTDRDLRGAHHNQSDPWTPVYVEYFNHYTLRRRIFVARESHILGMKNEAERDDDDDDDDNAHDDHGFHIKNPVIDCYVEEWDAATGRTWCGPCPVAVRMDDDEAGYPRNWMPDPKRDWGVWKPSDI